MHGKEAEQRDIIAKRREANGQGTRGGRGGAVVGRGGKSNHNPFRQATDGCAYLMPKPTRQFSSHPIPMLPTQTSRSRLPHLQIPTLP